LLNGHLPLSTTYIGIVYEFWFVALVLAYVASYSLAISRGASHSARSWTSPWGDRALYGSLWLLIRFHWWKLSAI